MPTFNTHRPYSKDGQVIEYSIVNADYDEFSSDLMGTDYIEYTVKFNDITRGITGIVNFTAHKDDNAPVSMQNRLLTAYDNGDYV